MLSRAAAEGQRWVVIFSLNLSRRLKMKIDRFVKLMLVLIALLLALNCTKDLNLSSEAAALPSFIQVGKAYNFSGFHATVLEIQSSGWLKTDAGWVNRNACISIKPE